MIDLLSRKIEMWQDKGLIKINIFILGLRPENLELVELFKNMSLRNRELNVVLNLVLWHLRSQ